MSDCSVVHDSVENIEKYVEPDSVDLILTDPPYPKEFLPLWSTLAEKAAMILKSGRVLIAYSNHANLPYVLLRMCPYLKYMWTFAIHHTGPHSSYFPARVWPNWKPILFFVKTPYTPKHNWIHDPIKGGGREKTLHNWQQSLSEAEKLIKYFSEEGDLVVDPFVGSGTIGAAAKIWQRDFFGLDIDEDAVETAQRRIERSQVQTTLEDSFLSVAGGAEE